MTTCLIADRFPYAWTSQLNTALIRSYVGQLHAWLFQYIIHRRVYNQVLTGVQGTRAGIKCLHCRACLDGIATDS